MTKRRRAHGKEIRLRIELPDNDERKAKSLYQRTRYGVGGCDTWSLDSYLCGVIANGLTMFARNMVGYPARYPSGEVWRKEVATNAAKARWAYKHYWGSLEERIRAMQNMRKVLAWISQHLGDLWW